MTISHSMHRLFTPEERIQLKYRDAAYWARFARGRCIGYRRGSGVSSWFARIRLKSGKYKQCRIGFPDDERPADGVEILSFPQALAAAEIWCSRFEDVAIERQRAWEKELELPDLPPSPPYTVAHAMIDYFNWARENTLAYNRFYYQIRAHILPHLGDIPVDELKPTTLRTWMVQLSEQPPRAHTGRDRPQQFLLKKKDPEYIRKRRRSTNKVLACLRAGLNRAFDRGLVEDDTAWTKVRSFRGVNQRKARFLDIDQIKKLIEACRPDLAMFVSGALLTGCRVSELRSMQVQDFTKKTGRIAVTDAKSKEQRAVSLSNEGIEFFKKLSARRKSTEYMFLRANGTRWKRGGHWKYFVQACGEAGIIPPIRFHELRHTYASQAVMAGVALKVVSTQLGHVDTRMVDRYYGRVGSAFIDEVIKERMPNLLPNIRPNRPR
jgi:integrase